MKTRTSLMDSQSFQTTATAKQNDNGLPLHQLPVKLYGEGEGIHVWCDVLLS